MCILRTQLSDMKLNPINLSLKLALTLTLGLSLLLLSSCETEPENQVHYDKALENGKSANEGLRRCQAYLEA